MPKLQTVVRPPPGSQMQGRQGHPGSARHAEQGLGKFTHLSEAQFNLLCKRKAGAETGFRGLGHPDILELTEKMGLPLLLTGMLPVS